MRPPDGRSGACVPPTGDPKHASPRARRAAPYTLRSVTEPPLPPRRRRGARWLLRQLLFWLVVALIPVAIWKIVTWPVGLPTR